MNIAEYLKSAKGNAWLMNDNCFMKWDGEWIVTENRFDPKLNHKEIYHGISLSEAIKVMSEASND